MTEIEHRPDCAGANLQIFTGAEGDRLQRCLSCFRFRVLEAPPTTSRYRCREHTDRATDWRGKGCRACQRDNQTKTRRTDDDDRRHTNA